MPEEIEKRILELKQDRRRLVDAENSLRRSQEAKAKANKKKSEVTTKLEELYNDVQKIDQEKSDLEMKLKIKEREYQLLCAMHEKDNQILQNKIVKKKKKIKGLKEELQRKDVELQKLNEQVSQLVRIASALSSDKEEMKVPFIIL